MMPFVGVGLLIYSSTLTSKDPKENERNPNPRAILFMNIAFGLIGAPIGLFFLMVILSGIAKAF